MKSHIKPLHTIFRRAGNYCQYRLSSKCSSSLDVTELKEKPTETQNHDSQKFPSRRNLLNGPNLKDFFTRKNLSIDTVSDVEKVPYVDVSNYGCGRKVYFDIYGCQMNVNDTEIIWSILKSNNFMKTENLEEADIALIITCAIREGAETKIWNRLEYLKGIKKKKKVGHHMKIGILGCMAERLKEKVLEKDKSVDVVAGPDSYKDLPRLLALTENNQTAINVLLSLDETYADIMPVRLNENSVSAYVSIMRGCDNMCTYCIVPFTRGKERSRPIFSIMDEVKHLSEQGVKEITLLGQNVNSYRDLSSSESSPINRDAAKTSLAKGFKTVYKNKVGGLRFADLLEKVASVDPEMRIRFTSPHPKDFPDEVLQVIQENPNICRNLHLPAQSGNSIVLERMRRGYTREAYLDLVTQVRDILPNVALSSDFICGFCGETDEEFQDTLSLMDIVRYNTAYIFPYSMREKTTAHRRYEDNVPYNIKQQRAHKLDSLYRSITESLNRQKIGQLQLVLVEGRSKRSNLHWAGRNDSNIKVIFPLGEIPIEDSHDVKPIKAGDYIVVQINDSTSLVLKGIPLYHTTLTEFNRKHNNSYSRSNNDYLKYTSML